MRVGFETFNAKGTLTDTHGGFFAVVRERKSSIHRRACQLLSLFSSSGLLGNNVVWSPERVPDGQAAEYTHGGKLYNI
jgi:hypothetical protein